MKYPIFSFASCLLVGAGVCSATAQMETISGVRGGNTVYRSGPYSAADLGLGEGTHDGDHFTIGDIALHPRIAVLAINEDNIFLSNQEPVEDSYVVFSPGLLASYGDTRKSSAYVDFTMDVPEGLDEDSEDVDSFRVNTLIHFETGKSKVNARYLYRDVRSGDIVIGNRVTKVEHVFYGGYDRAVSGKTGIGANVSYSQHGFESEDLNDYTDVKFSGRGYWTLSTRHRVFGQVSVGEVDVSSRVDAFGDADYVEVSIGVDSEHSSRWRTAGTIGYQKREFDREDNEDVEGITSSIQVNGYLFDHLNAGLDFSSLIRPAANEAGATVTEARLEPMLSRRIWIDDLVASASVVWGWVDYDNPDNQDTVGELDTRLVFDGRKDRYWGYTLGLDWHVSTQCALGAGYSYIENDSNSAVGEESASYEAERWMLRAQYNF